MAAAQRSGFAFLRVPVSARSAALGGAGAAFLEGAPAVLSNPAGIADRRGEASSPAPWGVAAEATLTHHEALADLRQDAATLRVAKGPDAFTAYFNSMYSERIELRDEVGRLEGSFGLTDLSAGLAYARTLAAGWRLGGGLAYVSEDLAGERATTWSASFGARWHVPAVRGLSLGTSLLHLGPGAEFRVEGVKGEEFALPFTVQGGAAFESELGSQTRILVTGETRKARDETLTGHLGIEIAYSMVALRAGSRIGTDEGDFTAGFGVAAGRFRFDYAFVSFGDALGDTHRAELAAFFGL